MHAKGARHRAAESKRKGTELIQRNEISKRLALFGSVSSKKSSVHVPSIKPLIEQAKKATSDVLNDKASSSKTNNNNSFRGAKSAVIGLSGAAQSQPPSVRQCISFSATDTDTGEKDGPTFLQHRVDYRERHEMELRFTSAGWKRDGNGKWFKDENVSVFA